MQLFYNSVALHDLGEISVSQSHAYDPPESPQRVLVTFKVKIDLFEVNFADNYGRVLRVREALRTQSAVLQWRDTDMTQDWLNQVVDVVSDDLPDEPNAWGTYQQQINLVFHYQEANLVTNNQLAQYRNGTGPYLVLGNVTKFASGYQAKRFSEMRDQRERAGGTVGMSGYFLASETDTLAARRASLLALSTALANVVNGSYGNLIYADFAQDVRIETFNAEVDQAKDVINWSLTASYTLFPNEDGYVTVEFEAGVREENEEGESFLNFTGRIAATDKTTAEAKLTLLRAAVLKQYGWNVSADEQTRKDTKYKYISANGDDATANLATLVGDTSNAFLELSFNEEYRRRRTDIITSTLRISSRKEVKVGLEQVTYSGSVLCSAATVDLAKALAERKANELGYNKLKDMDNGVLKGSIYLGSTLSWDVRHLNQTIVNGVAQSNTGKREFMRLDFSYEYQTKISDERVFLEVTEEATTELFGADSYSVSGSLVGKSRGACNTAYTSMVASSTTTYVGKLVRNERFTESRQSAKAILTQPGTDYLTQFIKLDFSFQSFKPKTVGGAIGMRYALDISRNFKTLEKVTTVSGSIFASATVINAICYGSNVAAEPVSTNFLDTFIAALGLTSPVETRRAIDHEYQPNTWTSGVISTRVDAILKLDFSSTYESDITGETGILECEVTEEVEYSAPRLVVQSLPGPSGYNVTDGTYAEAYLAEAVSVVQDCGIEPGRRTVRGSVTAASLAAAETWAKGKRLMLTGWKLPAETAYTHNKFPERMETQYVFKPRVNGIARRDLDGAAENARVWRCSFAFGEVLCYYPMPA